MSDKPMIFSAPSIVMLQAGRKTQTRRVLHIPKWASKNPSDVEINGDDGSALVICETTGCLADLPTPYRVGDRLWVRETLQTAMSDNGPCVCYRADSHRWYPKYDGPDEGIGPSFNYQKYPGDWSCWAGDVEARGPWRSPIHMPRWASRFTLTVTDVRIERLQDISEADAWAEGVWNCGEKDGGKSIPGEGVEQYRGLWNHLHGADAWAANPFVVALTFSMEMRRG